MKNLVFIIFVILSFNSCAKEYEASTGFDMVSIPPFLKSIESVFEEGLSASEIDELVIFTKKISVGSEKEKKLAVKFHGRETVLTYRVSMDDVDAPDVYFFTSDEEVADTLNSKIVQFFEKNGM